MRHSDAIEKVELPSGIIVYVYPDDSGYHDCPLDCLEDGDDVKVLIWERHSTLMDYNEFKNDEPADIPDWAFFHGYECFPLWKYEHSGVAYSVSEMDSRPGYPFNCPWDSFQTGWVLVKIGPDWKCPTLEVAESWAKALTTWCNGWYYGYVVEDKHGEHLDSCWGFDDSDYCLKEGVESGKHYVEKVDTKNARKLERQRPDMYEAPNASS